jgi:hypothetical protein
MVRRHGEHFPRQGRFGRREKRGAFVGHKVGTRPRLDKRDADDCLDIAGVEQEGALIKSARLRHVFTAHTLIGASHALKNKVHRVRVRRTFCTASFRSDQFCA